MSRNIECSENWMLQLLEEVHKKIQREMNAVQLTIVSTKYNLTSFFRAVLKAKS